MGDFTNNVFLGGRVADRSTFPHVNLTITVGPHNAVKNPTKEVRAALVMQAVQEALQAMPFTVPFVPSTAEESSQTSIERWQIAVVHECCSRSTLETPDESCGVLLCLQRTNERIVQREIAWGVYGRPGFTPPVRVVCGDFSAKDAEDVKEEYVLVVQQTRGTALAFRGFVQRFKESLQTAGEDDERERTEEERGVII